MSSYTFFRDFVPELLGLISVALVVYPPLRIFGPQALVRTLGGVKTNSQVAGEIVKTRATLQQLISGFSIGDFRCLLGGASLALVAALWKLVVVGFGF